MDKVTRNLVIITFIFIILATGGILYINNTSKPSADQNKQTASSTPSSSTTTMPTNAATPTSNSSFDANKSYQATIHTNMGNIKLQLNPKDALKTVQNFVEHSQKNYYDNLIFHRVSKGFVIQGGDPTGTGTGGESIFGKSFPDEINKQSDLYKTGYVKGVLAMANSGPNTNGSQFFILTDDHKDLPPLYTIFGKVVDGQDVVDKIGQSDLGKNADGTPITDGKPINQVTINTVQIVVSN